jgi:hypothetical protein
MALLLETSVRNEILARRRAASDALRRIGVSYKATGFLRKKAFTPLGSLLGATSCPAGTCTDKAF